MSDPFESPLFLIAQTKENLAEFDISCAALFDGDCSTRIVEVDPKTGNKTFKIKFQKTVPGRVRHIAATAISDMRHTLDQAAVACVKAITQSVPGLIYFPFATNPNDLMGRLRQSFPNEIHPTFVSFETYPTGPGHTGGNDFLARFNKIAGPNKHQIVCKVGGRIVDFRSGPFSSSGKIIDMVMPPFWDVDKNELVLGITSSDGNIDYDFNITFYIAFAEAGEMTGTPVSPFLRHLIDAVERMVLAIRTDTQCIVGRKF